VICKITACVQRRSVEIHLVRGLNLRDDDFIDSLEQAKALPGMFEGTKNLQERRQGFSPWRLLLAVANPPSRAGHTGRNAVHISAKMRVAGEDENSPAADGSIKTARIEREDAAGGGRIRF
jgi:hypothetical protein